ncbi:YkgJ family cysteine cluster protein [bacterium]|nr:YkgJ family cysteine cluster protein [bacterium]
MKRTKIDDWHQLLNFRCTGCAKCCSLTIVPVTDRDVARIMEATGLPANRIVRFYWPDDVKESRRAPGWIRLKQGKRFMGLRKVDGHCQFLQDNLCTIYSHRPVTCRLYPFNLFPDENGEVESLEINSAVKCEYALDGEESLESIRTLYDADEVNDEVYFAKIKEWNAKHPKGTAQEFLRFLDLVKDEAPVSVD